MHHDNKEENIGRREWLRRVAGTVAAAALAPLVGSAAPAGPEERNPSAGISVGSAEGPQPAPRKKRVSKVDARQQVGCVACDRCMPCGYGVDIPGNFEYYNARLAAGEIPDFSESPASGEFRRKALVYLRGYDSRIPDRHQSQRCIRCFHCVAECPEGVFIVNELAAMTELADRLRDWECRYL